MSAEVPVGGPPALSRSLSSVELIACETCGAKQRNAAGQSRGEQLFAELQKQQAERQAELGSRADPQPSPPITLSQVRCLWVCKEKCAVHLRSPGRVGYVLAVEPDEVSARALLDYAKLYAESADGAVPFKQWPAALRGHFLCRIPKTSAESAEITQASPEKIA
jgi:predicted metal-binding protein